MKQVQLRALEDLLVNLAENRNINNNSILISDALLLEVKKMHSFTEGDKLICNEDGQFLIGKILQLNIFTDSTLNQESVNIHDLGKNVIFEIKGITLENIS